MRSTHSAAICGLQTALLRPCSAAVLFLERLNGYLATARMSEWTQVYTVMVSLLAQ